MYTAVLHLLEDASRLLSSITKITDDEFICILYAQRNIYNDNITSETIGWDLKDHKHTYATL